MGLKKRAKVNAEFNMSSLTDIIFLLLIFFMLTSNLVRVDDVDIPESDSQTVAATSVIVKLTPDGKANVNGSDVPLSQMYRALALRKKENDQPGDFTITIVAEKEVAFDRVKEVMEIAGRLRAKAIIATKPKKS